MFLWLDDVRPAPPGWTHVKTIEEAQEHLKTGQVELCSLDHDLGYEKTGADLTRWMAENNIWPKTKPNVHSANPVGRLHMISDIERYWPGGDND